MADSSPILVKFPRDNLSAAAVCWLREIGVPLSQFGPNERKQNDNLEELIEPAAISLRRALSSVEQKEKEDENLDKLIQLASTGLDRVPSQAVLKAEDKYQIVDPWKENAQMVSGRDLQQDGSHQDVVALCLPDSKDCQQQTTAIELSKVLHNPLLERFKDICVDWLRQQNFRYFVEKTAHTDAKWCVLCSAEHHHHVP